MQEINLGTQRKEEEVVNVHKDLSTVLYTEEEIAARVREIGKALTRDYADIADEGIVLICVLRGAAVFMSDLARAIDLPLEMDYMVLSSYGSSTTSSGKIQVIKDLTSDIKNRHIIVAEDILDSGLTLKYVIEMLKIRQPASIRAVSMLKKQLTNQEDVKCEYIGFTCPNEFVVGYGLDFAERYRNLPYIGILKPEVYS